MTASKTITYLNVNTWVGYLSQLAKLARGHATLLRKRGMAVEVPRKLDEIATALQTAIEDHLIAQMHTKTESEQLSAARAELNEWMGLIKTTARIIFRNTPEYPLVKNDLRIGQTYQTKRVAAVLSESRAMEPGLLRHRDALLTRLDASEIDAGAQLIDKIASEAFNRTEALNEQLEKSYARNDLLDQGRDLARQVLDAADIAFREEDKDLRDLFFGLDERMSAGVGEG